MTALMGMCGILAAVAIYGYFNDNLPKISTLNDYRPPVISTVYSDDGRKIGEFYKERRIVVPLSEIPEVVKQAFIAAEDSRFYKHKGVDLLSIIRAFIKNMEAGTIVQGGSTITQQVTKSFLLTPERSYIRKIKEAILAYRIDKSFSKDEILYLYLNQIYLGHGAYGIRAASENYFGKSVDQLSLAEAAMLAGLPQAPSKYSPFSAPEKAKQRQIYVLNRMAAEGYITESKAAEAVDEKLDIQPRRNWYIEKVPFFTEYVRQYVENKYGPQALNEAGLKIYTTVNLDMQQAAENAVKEGLSDLDKRHSYGVSTKAKTQAAMICLETGTNYVKAMVGGRDFRESQFNRAIQSRRQPGSAFKPIIYAAALDKGYTPASMLIDSPIVFKGGDGLNWKPKNYKDTFYGPTLLREALTMSRNVVTIKILQDIGVGYAINYARKLGITSPISRDLSIALGSSGVSLLELVKAYSVFANHGELIEPVFITKIEDREGNVIEETEPVKKRVIEKSTAYLITNLLESVVQNGTGKRVKALNRPVAGKTGTTNDLFDAWFVGFTPQYVTGTWVGFDEEKTLGESETGSRAAIPIWLGFMQKTLADKPVLGFSVPEGVVFSKIDAKTGLLPSPESKNTIFECFKEGTAPRQFTPKPDAIVNSADFFKTGL